MSGRRRFRRKIKTRKLENNLEISVEGLTKLFQHRNCEEEKICPHCNSERIIKFGKNRLKKQRYKCKTCEKIFCDTTNTAMSYTKKNLEQWLKYIRSMHNKESIRESAVTVEINKNTSFQWRHKILNTIKGQMPETLSGIVEIDEVRIKESHKGSKSSENSKDSKDSKDSKSSENDNDSKNSEKNNFSKENNFSKKNKSEIIGNFDENQSSNKFLENFIFSPKVCLLCCKDRENNIIAQAICKGRPNASGIKYALSGKILVHCYKESIVLLKST